MKFSTVVFLLIISALLALCIVKYAEGKQIYVAPDICTLSNVSCLADDLIKKEAIEHGFNVEDALRIAYCESKFDPKAKNKSSSAKGLYQFVNKTWDNYCSGSALDAEDNVHCFFKLYQRHKNWWSASKSCWSK